MATLGSYVPLNCIQPEEERLASPLLVVQREHQSAKPQAMLLAV